MGAHSRSGGEHAAGWLAEGDGDDAGPFGPALAGAQVERHAGPPPVVDLAAHGDEGLGFGRRRDAGLVEVAAVLPPHDVRWLDRAERPEDLVLLLADGAGVEGRRWLHGVKASTCSRWVTTMSRQAPLVS